EIEIGFTQAIEGGMHVGPAVIPGLGERGGEGLEAALRDVGQERVTVAVVPIRRGRADTGPTRRVRKGEAGRPLLRNQFKRGAHQSFLEIAVVIAARAVAPAPTHAIPLM